MYLKFGQTLRQTNKYNLNIIGFSSKNTTAVDGIHFHPIYDFNRLSLKRVLASFTFFSKALKVKPKVIIVNTFELLIVSLWFKILFGTRIVYDLRENYALNIHHSKTFPKPIAHLIALAVRLKERLVIPFFDELIVAERTYLHEMPYLAKRATLIENKYLGTIQSESKPHKGLHFIFTGTLSESYGVYDAIDFISSIHDQYPITKLTIIGYAPNVNDQLKINDLRAKYSFIKLIGIDSFVPHEQIISAIRASDYALLFYQNNESTAHCIPTKLYEYLANGIPILYRENSLWESIIRQYEAGTKVPNSPQNVASFIQDLQAKKFYPNKPGSEILWESEGEKLKTLLEKLT
ncbi:glycosyltransferase [Penaeicola halotolerans]|uniref:glycosyltransferase n=1 Tax=Penaeicola halotolerans TaxID=2793196 RepID=UPI001CF8AAE9|nr:glycosyltransferase [Penaeicola halotolerans]